MPFRMSGTDIKPCMLTGYNVRDAFSNFGMGAGSWRGRGFKISDTHSLFSLYTLFISLPGFVPFGSITVSETY